MVVQVRGYFLVNSDAKIVAKALFGRPARLLLAAWITSREGEPFFQQEAMDAMRTYSEAGSAVQTELELFVKYGLLQRTPSETRVYFVVLESPFWAPLLEAGRAVDAYMELNGPSGRSGGPSATPKEGPRPDPS